MLKINEQKFSEMDELSLQKVPFFFVIDFLMENTLDTQIVQKFINNLLFN